MIRVIATISCKPGCQAAFLREFQANVPTVLAEEGCLLYEPCVDTQISHSAGTPLRADVVTVVEAWESHQHLEAHLVAPHMAAYRERVKDLVAGVGLHVVEPVRD